MSRHVTWDYEESRVSHYHIYPVSGEGEELMEDVITFELPQTKKNDDDVQIIVDTLDRMAEGII